MSELIYINQAYCNILKARDINTRPTPNADWRVLFNYYNKFNPPLSMGCMPCYQKVEVFIIHALRNL